jgi:four helix bundle protein
MIMNSYTDLNAWKFAMELLADVHTLTKSLPSAERFGLIDQLHRATKSILLNIAEGYGRYTYADKINKYVIARGECTEVEAGILIAVRLGYVSAKKTEHILERANTTGKLLSGLIAATRQKISHEPS